LAALLLSCGGDPPAQDTLTTEDSERDDLQEARLEKTRKIFYSIPSPMETASLLKRAGAVYNKDILNDVKNVDNYTSASKQALNLGIYGADLSYASVFNHTQESMFYTSCAKKLADRLGVSAAFNDSTLEAMEANMDDRDALLDIISETYWNVDAYLKENERDNISALMIAGGWVEGLYIATQVAKIKATDELRQRIAEQRYALGDLISLIETYDSDDPALLGVLQDLRSLQELYSGLPGGSGGTSTSEDTDGVTVIGSADGPLTISDAQLASITARVAEIRNAYIN
jgi:hypothetical protein